MDQSTDALNVPPYVPSTSDDACFQYDIISIDREGWGHHFKVTMFGFRANGSNPEIIASRFEGIWKTRVPENIGDPLLISTLDENQIMTATDISFQLGSLYGWLYLQVVIAVSRSAETWDFDLLIEQFDIGS